MHTVAENTEKREETASLTLHMAGVGLPDWSEQDLYRAIVVNLPRQLQALDKDARRRVLAAPPPLTHTPWDALIAAVAEHVAMRDGLGIEAWMNAPERFVDEPWLAGNKIMRWEAMWYTPAAFVRHGTPVHPSDLDERGGDNRWEDQEGRGR